MLKFIAIIVGAVVALLLIGSVLSAAQDAYAPSALDYARESAEIARLERAQAQAEVLAPVWTLAQAIIIVGAPLVLLGVSGVALLKFFRGADEVRPDDRGLLPVRRQDLGHVAPAALLDGYHSTRQIAASVSGNVPHALHYAPTYHRADGAAGSLPALEPPAAAALPGLTDLASIGFTPSVGAILLGLGAGGERITVPMKALWHIGTAGPTGAGKSNIARLVLPQLLSLGAKVCIVDPKWTPYDHESGEDWRGIAARLHLAPARKPAEIQDTIGYFHDELERRLELRNAGQRVGGPLFLYADEFTTITEDVKDASERMARLGRLGRGVGIFLLVAAHDLLVKSGAGDMRDQLRTGYYLGGDVKTGSVLLDMPMKDVTAREAELTTGVAMLRSAATAPARLVRVPLASNAGIAAMLDTAGGEAGASPGAALPPAGRAGEAAREVGTSPRQDALSPRDLRVADLLANGASKTAIIAQIWGVEGGKAFAPASAEYDQVLARLATAAARQRG